MSSLLWHKPLLLSMCWVFYFSIILIGLWASIGVTCSYSSRPFLCALAYNTNCPYIVTGGTTVWVHFVYQKWEIGALLWDYCICNIQCNIYLLLNMCRYILCTWCIHAVYACCVIISNHNRAAIKMYVVTHTASLQISMFSIEVTRMWSEY